MKRLVAATVVIALSAGPALAAAPSAAMMAHCLSMPMPCHDMAALTCCTTSPAEPATPAVRVTTTATTGQPTGPSLHVIAVIATGTLPGGSPFDGSPPRGYQPGELLLRLSTLLI